MSLATLVADYSYEQRAGGPAELHQPFALEEHVVLAVALGSGDGPVVGHAVLLDVGDRFDLVIDRAIDGIELGHPRWAGKEPLLLLGTLRARLWHAFAEANKPIGGLSKAEHAHEGRGVVLRAGNR